MPDHMIVAAFADEPDAALLPAERERLKELVSEGVVRAVYLSADRSEAWLVVRGNGPHAVRNTMESLPLYPFMGVRGITEVQGVTSSAD